MVTKYTSSEKEQANVIIKRWRNYFYPHYTLIDCALIFLITALTHHVAPVYYTLLFLYIISPRMEWLARRTVKPFIRRLSNEERELLERYAEYSTDNSLTTTTRELLKANKVNAPKELLRASARAEDDTLLRAAQYSENAPQEQLLRPLH